MMLLCLILGLVRLLLIQFEVNKISTVVERAFHEDQLVRRIGRGIDLYRLVVILHAVHDFPLPTLGAVVEALALTSSNSFVIPLMTFICSLQIILATFSATSAAITLACAKTSAAALPAAAVLLSSMICLISSGDIFAIEASLC